MVIHLLYVRWSWRLCWHTLSLNTTSAILPESPRDPRIYSSMAALSSIQKPIWFLNVGPRRRETDRTGVSLSARSPKLESSDIRVSAAYLFHVQPDVPIGTNDGELYWRYETKIVNSSNVSMSPCCPVTSPHVDNAVCTWTYCQEYYGSNRTCRVWIENALAAMLGECL